MQRNLASGKTINNFLYLPPTGRLGAAAVELNVHFSLPRTWFGFPEKYPSPKKHGAPENALIPFREVIEQRFASLSRDGIEALYRAQIRHMTRSPEMVLTLPAQFSLEAIEAERPNPDPLPSRGWTIPDPKGILPLSGTR